MNWMSDLIPRFYRNCSFTYFDLGMLAYKILTYEVTIYLIKGFSNSPGSTYDVP